MKTRNFTLGILSLAVLSAIGVSSLMVNAQAPAAQNGQAQGLSGLLNAQRPPRSNTIKRTVTNIENGVIVTCTSDNADEVKMIQSHTPPTPPKDSKVSVVKENLSNGIKVTITSTDAETIKNIQAREAQGGRGMHRGMQNDVELKDVKRVVTNTADGVTISISSTDPETVKVIQEREAKGPQGFDGQRGMGMGRGMGRGMEQR